MKRPLIVREGAAADLQEAFEWYEQRMTGLGHEFLDEWEKLALYIERNPELFRERKRKFRLARFERFPYLIVFVIEKNAVVVYGVVHTKRHSSRVFRRK